MVFDKQQRVLKRSARLISVLSKYGFQDVLVRLNLSGHFQSDTSNSYSNHTTYERIRLALQDLGPTFVKLGQTFSSREDMLPMEFIHELEKLQDNVETIDLNIKERLAAEFGINVDEHFFVLDEEPLAAASIAQVYKGVLKDQTPVIIKIKRPGIDEIIHDDILLLKDLITLIDTYSDLAERVNLKHAVIAFEQSLKEELSLKNELQNIKLFQQNFDSDSATYVPRVFEDYSNDSILTMEFIDGVKVTDLDSMRSKGLDPIKIAENGYRLFVTQILEHGVFHADPHAGNLMVMNDGRLVFIDFGAVGKIPSNEKPTLERMILSLMSKKPEKVVRYLKKMALHYDIGNERQFESDVAEVLDYVHSTALGDIDVATIVNKMKDVLKENRLVMPNYFYLLFKGITLMDGVGRKINPDLDVMGSLKPFTKRMITKKLEPEALMKRGWEKLTDFADDLEEIPDEIRSVLYKLHEDKLSINTDIKNYPRFEQLIKTSVIDLILGVVLAANIIATSLFTYGNVGPKLFGASILAIGGFLFSSVLIILLTLRLLRR